MGRDRWRALTRPLGRTLAADDPSPLRCLLELVAVSGLAVAQPVLDVIGNSPDIFVVRQAGWADVVLLVLAIVLGPPLVGWVVELLAGLVHRRARHLAHLVLLGTFATLFAIQAVKEVTDLGWRRVLVLGVVLGLGLVVLVMNVRPVRSWLRLFAAFPVVLGVLFIFSAPAREVVFDDDTAAAVVTPSDPAPVVMIVLDELPLGSMLDADGRVDRTLFPNLARLAGDSTWYRNHTTVAPITVEAVPAILTGQWPEFGRSPTAADHPENLFTLLGGRYSLHVRETGTRLCPAGLCAAKRYGALPGLLRDARDVWMTQAQPKPTEEVLDIDVVGALGSDDARATAMTDFAHDLGPSDGAPRLDFAHVFLPHGAWNFLPSGARYVGPHPPMGNFFFSWNGEFAGAAGRERHLLQLQYTDRLLGGVLDRLGELDTYDESLVVVTADHGVSFRSRQTLRSATPGNYPDVMWTPLFIKAPGQDAGEVVDEPSRSIDVLPTIADHLGVDLPWRVDGTSLLRPRDETDEVRILASGLGQRRNVEDDYLVFDGVEGYRQALASGGGIPRDPLGVYRIGRYGGLVGTPVEDVDAGEGSGLEARLDDPGAYEDVDPESDELPVYLTGTVTAEHPPDVVVAVNGVVAGWCETAAAGTPDGAGEERSAFWVLVPESLLAPGENAIELFQVEGPAGAPRLRPIALE